MRFAPREAFNDRKDPQLQCWDTLNRGKVRARGPRLFLLNADRWTSWYIAQATAPSTCVAASRSKIGCIHQGQRSLCGGPASPRISGNHAGALSAVGGHAALFGELLRVIPGLPTHRQP